MSNTIRNSESLWMEAVLNGTATPEDYRQLSAFLRGHPERIAAWIAQTRIHTLLARNTELIDLEGAVDLSNGGSLALEIHGGQEQNRPQGIPDCWPRTGRFSVGVFWKWAAGLAVLLGGAALFFAVRARGPEIATVTNVYYAFDTAGKPVAKNTRLTRGEWRWNNGLIELRMMDRTCVLVEAPATIRAQSASRLQLFSGHVVVRMVKGRDGFIVDTPRMTLLDRGTEFGVSVAPNGESSVQVFDGEVLASSNLQPVEKTLKKNEAAAVAEDGTFQSIEPSRCRFIRRLPPKDTGAPISGFAFNTPRYSGMEAFPLARPPVIDGDLSDWPTNLTFQSACNPPYDQDYTVEARVGYDAANLYLGVAVGDPDPMRNRGKENVFAGGSVIFRLAAEPGLPCPMKSVYDSRTTNISSDLALADRLSTFICWYDMITGLPRLRAEKWRVNMFYENPTNVPGWQGVFKRHPDGRGYTMEYAIPWASAGVVPPRPGEVRANTWNIHWGDAEGCVSVGQLVENVRPVQPGMAFPPVFRYFYFFPAWGTMQFMAPTNTTSKTIGEKQ